MAGPTVYNIMKIMIIFIKTIIILCVCGYLNLEEARNLSGVKESGQDHWQVYSDVHLQTWISR